MGKLNFTDIDKAEKIEDAQTYLDTKKGKADKTTLYQNSFRAPGICCAYIRQKAWMNRKSLSDTITEMILEDMKKHPEIVEDMDETSYMWLKND